MRQSAAAFAHVCAATLLFATQIRCVSVSVSVRVVAASGAPPNADCARKQSIACAWLRRARSPPVCVFRPRDRPSVCVCECVRAECARTRVYVRMRVHAFVRERARARACVRVRSCVRARACACVCVRARACASVCERACTCVRVRACVRACSYVRACACSCASP
eukprot:591527-Pleurochrysis_carterae.AAC.1